MLVGEVLDREFDGLVLSIHLNNDERLEVHCGKFLTSMSMGKSESS
jgi:hypothetical protein